MIDKSGLVWYFEKETVPSKHGFVHFSLMIPTIVFAGPPCGGKETLQRILLSQFMIDKPIGVGDLCRREEDEQSDLWKAASAHMSKTRSTLWPDELIAQLLGNVIETSLRESTALVFDGFPRSRRQISLFTGVAKSHGLTNVLLVHIHAKDSACIERAEKRKRPDDVRIVERLAEYNSETVPAIEQLLGMNSILPVQYLRFDGNQPKQQALEKGAKFCRTIGELLELVPRPVMAL